ncbi:MAG: type II toxin-antitoxin system HicA family toxin [bacterium]|nr:type II toxin-antitoxin system HicA family toxin [bacterium]MDZ4299347.1 type II toxin-antitoxin system HicA family toxin [Candidatus Sungbacteria bacterium]
MHEFPHIKPIRVLKALQRAGFYVDHITGSHYILYRDDRHVPVSVPRHNRDMKIGTLKGILKQSGMTLKRFKEFL